MSKSRPSSLRRIEFNRNIPTSRTRMAAQICWLESKSSIEPLSSLDRSIRNLLKSGDWAMLRRGRDRSESAFSVWLVSADSAIWSCISGGMSSKPMDTMLQASRGYVQHDMLWQVICSVFGIVFLKLRYCLIQSKLRIAHSESLVHWRLWRCYVSRQWWFSRREVSPYLIHYCQCVCFLVERARPTTPLYMMPKEIKVIGNTNPMLLRFKRETYVNVYGIWGEGSSSSVLTIRVNSHSLWKDYVAILATS
jgi:hypothetical protein